MKSEYLHQHTCTKRFTCVFKMCAIMKHFYNLNSTICCFSSLCIFQFLFRCFNEIKMCQDSELGSFYDFSFCQFYFPCRFSNVDKRYFNIFISLIVKISVLLTLSFSNDATEDSAPSSSSIAFLRNSRNCFEYFSSFILIQFNKEE